MNPPKLYQWRVENDYTRIRLGKSLGVTTMTVYRWEKGTRDMPPFLYLALRYLELKGGEIGPEDKRKIKGRKIKGMKRVVMNK